MDIRKLCPRARRLPAVSLLQPDPVAIRVGSVVDLEGLAAAVVGSAEDSAEGTEDSAAEEVESDIKVGTHLPEEEGSVGHLMGLVMALCLLQMHLQVPVGTVEASGLVATVAHQLMVA